MSYDEGDQKPSSSSSQRRPPLPGVSTSTASAMSRNATSRPAQRANVAPGEVLIRRTVVDSRIPNTLDARAGPGSRLATEAQLGVRARAAPAPGQILQRTGTPRPGQGQYQRQGQRFPPRGQQSQGRPGGPPTDRRVRRLNQQNASKKAEALDPDALEAADLPTRVETYVNTIVDPPANPTTELPHIPGTHLTSGELRKDWPNTPLSNVGLVESVQQRIEWLAHRLPHGYQTPNQLAYHYADGNLTRFESVEERDKVLTISRTLAQKWADRDTDKDKDGSGMAVQPEDMEFDSLVERTAERQGLADTWVRGTYPEVQKQRMPFMDQIVRNLNNNVTVTGGKTSQFMQTVQSVITRQVPQGVGQAKKRIQK